MRRAKLVVLRDLAIFQVKLLLDAVKDIALSPMAVGAAMLDVMSSSPDAGRRFYAVMRLGERVDRWLNLYGAAQHVTAESDGLFGASRAGADSFLGRIEEIVIGHAETEQSARRA